MKKIYLKVFALALGMVGWSAVASAQFSEGFESGIPSTWTVIDNDGQGNTWASYTGTTSDPAYQGTKCARIKYETNAHDDYLITPQFTVTAGTSDQLRFYARNYSSSLQEQFDILISTTGTAVADFDTLTVGGTNITEAITPPEPNYQEYIYDLSDYVGQNVYIAFRAISTNKYYLYVDDVNIEKIPTCPKPSDLTASNLMSQSANLGWTENGSAGEWQIEYDTTGFTQGTGTIVSNIGTNPYTLNTLSSNYTYDYYVRSVCGPGDTSLWVGPYTFHTPCGVVTAPYSYDVESAVPSTNSLIQDCWSSNPSNTTLDYRWNVTDDGTTPSSNTGASSAHSGSQYFYTEASSGSQGDIATITTPSADISGLSNPSVQFYYFMYGSDMNELNIEVSDDNGASWSNIGNISGEQQTAQTDPWMQKIIPLTGYTGTVLVRFSATRGSSYEGDICIDDISIENGPSCYKPAGLTTNGVTATSADLAWENPSNASEWQVQYDTTGFTLGNGTMVNNVLDTFTTVPMANHSTIDFYVRTVCGPGDTSVWAGPFTVSNFYCIPSGTSTTYGIKNLTTTGALINLNNVNSGISPNGYGDFTATDTLVVLAGQTVTATIENMAGYTNMYDLWIDWNKNLSFEDNPTEHVYSSSSYESSPANLVFTIPNVTTPFITRMRVRNGEIGHATACETGFSYGEAEDYILKVVPVPSCLPPFDLTTNDITATSADLAWADTTGATEFQVQYDTTGFTLGNGTMVNNVLDTFTTVPMANHSTIDFYVRTVCSVGDTSFWAGPFTISNFYCTPSGTSTTYGINSITTAGALENLHNINSGISPNGYGDFTATDTLIAYAGQTVTATIDNMTGYTNNFELWIDWNKDLSFEENPTEHVYSSPSYENSPANIVFTIPNVTTPFITRMRVRNGDIGHPTACETGFSYGEAEDYILKIVPVPSCLPPIDLTIDNLTATSVNLAWADTTGATEWQVEYDTTGFVQGTGNMVSNVLDTFTNVSISPNTQYDFYVRTVCGAGDTSYWAGPYTFISPCTSYDANGFWETVEENSSTLGCWRVRDVNGDGDTWAINTTPTYANNGDRSFSIHTDFNSGANNDYLISPAINLTGAESLKFSYRVRSSTEPNDFEVLLSTTGTLPSDFTDTLMYDANYSNTDYKDTVVDLTSYTGTVYIAFHVPQGGLDGYYLYIDDVRFGQCIPTPGTDGAKDACQTGGNVDLPSIIQTNNNYGTWEFPANSSVIQNGDEFNVSTLAGGAYDVMYVVQGLCAGEADTTIATVNVYPPSSAGTNGTVTVCKNEEINLFDGLQGNVDMGGTWYDPSNQPITGSQPNAGTIPGNFNYFYVVSNTACPADTALVNVIVDGTCDATGLANEAFKQLSVFPNPTSNKINIVNPTNEENLKVVVLDMNGRVVLRDNKSLSNNEKATLSLNKLDKGIYTLKVSNAKGQKVFKIVKQ